MEVKIEVTQKELVENYGILEENVVRKFGRAQEQMRRRYGLGLLKEGRAGTARYFIVKEGGDMNKEYENVDIFEEKNGQVMVTEEMYSSLSDLNFIFFLGVCFTEDGYYVGTRNRFLERLHFSKTKKNRGALMESLEELKKRGYIIYLFDEYGKKERLYISIRLKVLDEIPLRLDVIRQCKEISEKRSFSWEVLIKVWTGIGYLMVNRMDGEPITRKELSALTGESLYYIDKARKILEEEEVLAAKLNCVYDGKNFFRLGTAYALNDIYNKKDAKDI